MYSRYSRELADLEQRPEAARQSKARPSSSQVHGLAVDRNGRTASFASQPINPPVRPAAAPHPPKPTQAEVRASVEPKYKNDQEIAHDQAWSTATYSDAYHELFGECPDHAIGNPKTICDNAHEAKLPARVYIIVAIHAWKLAHPGMKFDGRYVKYPGSDAAYNAVLTWLDAAQKVSTRDESGLAIAFKKMKNGEINWAWVPGPRDKFIEDCRALIGAELSKPDYECLLRLAGDYGGEQRLQRLAIRVRIAIANSPGKTLAEAVRPLLED